MLAGNPGVAIGIERNRSSKQTTYEAREGRSHWLRLFPLQTCRGAYETCGSTDRPQAFSSHSGM